MGLADDHGYEEHLARKRDAFNAGVFRQWLAKEIDSAKAVRLLGCTVDEFDAYVSSPAFQEEAARFKNLSGDQNLDMPTGFEQYASMRRKITEHVRPGSKNTIAVDVIDAKLRDDGAPRTYVVSKYLAPHGAEGTTAFCFQHGPVGDKGNNGITVEALIAACCDELVERSKESGWPYNDMKALEKLQEAQMWLQRGQQ